MTDEAEIGAAVEVFFAAFTSGADLDTRMDALRALCLPQAVITRTCGMPVEVYDVEGFLAPRRDLLRSGRVEQFREWPVSGRTDVFGDVAQHWCRYEKSWTEGGAPRTGRGMKTLQFVRTAGGWRIAAAAWDDERPGLSLGAP